MIQVSLLLQFVVGISVNTLDYSNLTIISSENGLSPARADPGFEVRGGANGLENLKTGGWGGGVCIFLLNMFILYRVIHSVKLFFRAAL